MQTRHRGPKIYQVTTETLGLFSLVVPQGSDQLGPTRLRCGLVPGDMGLFPPIPGEEAGSVVVSLLPLGKRPAPFI